MASANGIAVWRALTLSGAALAAIGLGAFLLDFASIGDFLWLEEHLDQFFFAIPIGILVVFVGAIGWARHLERSRRVTLAGIVFIVPVSVCALVGLFASTNVHGPFFLFLLPIAPALLLSLILLMMPAGTKS
jgi:hypothetical protein